MDSDRNISSEITKWFENLVQWQTEGYLFYKKQMIKEGKGYHVLQPIAMYGGLWQMNMIIQKNIEL